MTIRDWLRERSPSPPAALLRRVEDAFGPDAELPIERLPALALDAAERLLSEVLACHEAGRERALDLLAVDALVTYAFEGAAAARDDLASLGALAEQAMKRIATVGISGPVPAC